MLKEIRYSKAIIVQQTLAVAKHSNNSVATRNLTRVYDTPKEKIQRTFWGDGGQHALRFPEKGYYVDYYA